MRWLVAVRMAEEESVLRERVLLLRYKGIVYFAVLCKNHARSTKCTVWQNTEFPMLK